VEAAGDVGLVAFVPANGAGLEVVQVQPSPPEPLPLAPAGSASSNHTALLAAVLLTGDVERGRGVELPARSRATALSVCGPFAAEVESHVVVNGAARDFAAEVHAVEFELHADDADVVSRGRGDGDARTGDRRAVDGRAHRDGGSGSVGAL